VKRLKVLISAYACRPGEGSEPGVGWNVVRELVEYHDLLVLTRADNRPSIEAELSRKSLPGVEFVYCEPPRIVQNLNYNQRLVHLHYYLWQIAAYIAARKLSKQFDIDIVHHVTYVRYSSPSFLSLLPIPFIWGPVGGGESAPKNFWKDFSLWGTAYETSRNLARALGEIDPFVRLTAKRSVIARGTTQDTAERLHKLGAKNVQIISQLGLSEDEIAQLGNYKSAEQERVRFITVGRLLHWKGVHLGLKAFAQADLPDNAEYWIVGDGPERSRLEQLTETLGIRHKVKFWDRLSRKETLEKLEACIALIHPSLHESGGMVCLEAMAAGRPVICLNLGGPATQITEETGFKISAQTPNQSVCDIAVAMTRLAQDRELLSLMSQHGRQRVKELYSWKIKGQLLAQLYEEVDLSRSNDKKYH
jgi:glycosyltransferase involved in cell wall biosynthesis